MKTAVKSNVEKIDYDEFIKMVEADEFRVNEVNYSEIIYNKDKHQAFYPVQKREADNYNVGSVFNLFNELCIKEQKIIDIHTYMKEYEQLVENNLEWNIFLGQIEKDIIKNIMKLRAYSAYKSNLAEISLKLLCQKIGNNEYNIHMTEDTDLILGVDIVLEHKERNEAHYIHITKDSRFADEKLKRKAKKNFEVFNYDTQEVETYCRNFDGHIMALYDDKQKNNHIINGCYIFKEEYIRELLEENKGSCDKTQFEELVYIDLLKNVQWDEA